VFSNPGLTEIERIRIPLTWAPGKSENIFYEKEV
jgi:hypothetical protein